MNKLFAFALLALVAACTAASLPNIEIEPGTEHNTNLEDGVGVNEQTKRAILYRSPLGGAYYPGYRYRYASPASALSYLNYPTVPYYGRYII